MDELASYEEVEKETKVFDDAKDYLIKHLDPDDLFDDAVKENIISPSAQRQIRPSTEEKSRILVQQFKMSGPGTLEKVCKLLRKPGRDVRQGHIADFLECKYTVN